MFGYVRPLKPELKVRDYEFYRAVYCGLCHSLRARYGIGSRMLLSYDMCFLALLINGVTGCGVTPCAKRCVVSPIRRRTCIRENEALDFTADCSVILTYWKVLDGIRDGSGLRKLGLRFAASLLKGKYRRASARLPSFAQAVEQGIDRLDELERAQTPSLDRTADAFAGMLRAAAGGLTDDKARRPVEQILYHIGRWIYILDAWDDLQEDLQSGCYNAVAARFDLGTPEEEAAAKQSVRLTLLQSAQTAAAAAELLDLGQSDPVIKNVLYLGLPAMAENVMEGLNKQRSSRHGSI